MSNHLTDEKKVQILELIKDCGDQSDRELGRRAGVDHSTIAKYRAMPTEADLGRLAATQMKAQIAYLKARLKVAEAAEVNAARIRTWIGGVNEEVSVLDPLPWTLEPRKPSSPGVPTLMFSDFHWGEVVDPKQINGVNKYNLDIAHTRLKSTVDSAITLLQIVSPKMDYPGLILPLGGDMVSGNIHEELAATNEINTIPTCVDLWSALVENILTLLNYFPEIFIPCVSGNHGRNTHKTWNKDRNATSFDWMIYTFLAKRFADEPRVHFYIPDGLDAHFNVYDYRYKLEHGDQLGKGGDGIIGALGPIIRGDQKKRSRDTQIDLGYDTLMIGHYHQYTHMQRVIVNGSLKGYDEYANAWGFGYEAAQQALWITHPKHGITFRMPVYADRGSSKTKAAEWVTVFGGRK